MGGKEGEREELRPKGRKRGRESEGGSETPKEKKGEGREGGTETYKGGKGGKGGGRVRK